MRIFVGGATVKPNGGGALFGFGAFGFEAAEASISSAAGRSRLEIEPPEVFLFFFGKVLEVFRKRFASRPIFAGLNNNGVQETCTTGRHRKQSCEFIFEL
jgi:hypothetical protein